MQGCKGGAGRGGASMDRLPDSQSQELGAVHLLDARLCRVPGAEVDDREVLALGVVDLPSEDGLTKEKKRGMRRQKTHTTSHETASRNHQRQRSTRAARERGRGVYIPEQSVPRVISACLAASIRDCSKP